ncbi:hypothetical protein OK016_18485 [Vibrio chagasii]|nr:hypothetical protein [Vibrio chagasii]
MEKVKIKGADNTKETANASNPLASRNYKSNTMAIDSKSGTSAVHVNLFISVPCLSKVSLKKI